MLFPEIIRNKRNGEVLTKKEIRFLVQNYTSGKIPDYQMSAWLMAVFFRGLDNSETAELTMAMMQSGRVLDLAFLNRRSVDKHSTGGVGDKVSLALAPLVTAGGVAVPMISGRGLGHTGGTLDKLEAIPGFNTGLDVEEFLALLKKNGLAMGGQTKDLAPADKKLYALRDVTATVESIPLIAASIMSKKLAEGADAFVFDVKVGSGAFMRELSMAEELAQTLVAIARNAGRDAVALLTDMNQPLGYAIGNALEVSEIIDLLKGNGPDDLKEITLVLAAYMFYLGHKAENIDQGYAIAESLLSDGSALEKFVQMVGAQGGDIRVVEDPGLLKPAMHSGKVVSSREGYINSIDTLELGLVSVLLGAGREKTEDIIDPGAGIVVNSKINDYVKKGDVLAEVFCSEKQALTEAVSRIGNAYTVAERKIKTEQLVLKVID